MKRKESVIVILQKFNNAIESVVAVGKSINKLSAYCSVHTEDTPTRKIGFVTKNPVDIEGNIIPDITIMDYDSMVDVINSIQKSFQYGTIAGYMIDFQQYPDGWWDKQIKEIQIRSLY